MKQEGLSSPISDAPAAFASTYCIPENADINGFDSVCQIAVSLCDKAFDPACATTFDYQASRCDQSQSIFKYECKPLAKLALSLGDAGYVTRAANAMEAKCATYNDYDPCRDFAADLGETGNSPMSEIVLLRKYCYNGDIKSCRQASKADTSMQQELLSVACFNLQPDARGEERAHRSACIALGDALTQQATGDFRQTGVKDHQAITTADRAYGIACTPDEKCGFRSYLQRLQ